ncbi:MAG: SLC13 family permease [Pirellulales bacterium]
MNQPQVECSSSVAVVGRWLGISVAFLLWLAPSFGYAMDVAKPELNYMAGIMALMAIFWLTEAIPMAATALLPLALYPLLKIQKAADVSQHYGSHFLFLFLGGFLIALAIEESGLHRRVALSIIYAVGDRPRRVILGFMLATAGLSMWISNTATTLLMLPIAVSVLGQISSGIQDEKQKKNLCIGLMLSIAYAASIGGCATLIGTPPNVAFANYFETQFPNEPAIGFASWLMMVLPFSLIFLIICWVVLTRLLFPVGGESSLGGRTVIQKSMHELGPMSQAEWTMGVVFVCTALLWVLREPVSGWGWAPLLGVDEKWANDSTTAIVMSIICFLLPSGKKDKSRLLEWSVTKRVPWGILLLFGGGVALAKGLQATGLDLLLGQQLASAMRPLSPDGMIAVSATGMVWLTEFTSNLASINMLLPVLDGTAQQLKVEPLLLMLPATLAASCAFMMPVATPPNAIIYGSGHVPIRQMIKAGIVLNLISSVLIWLVVRFLAPLFIDSL